MTGRLRSEKQSLFATHTSNILTAGKCRKRSEELAEVMVPEKRTTEVSVIMPVYNAGGYLAGAVESILRQTYRDFELLLVDDGSSDGSADICDAYARKDGRVTVFHQENRGICAARNRGLDAARGKYIAFCDHDDLYEDDCLETLWNEAERSNAQLVRGNFRVIRQDQNGNPAVTQTGGGRRVELDAFHPILRLHDSEWAAFYLELYFPPGCDPRVRSALQ